MIGVIVAILLFVGALVIMIASIANNQINQTYESALGYSYAGMISISTALVGLVISIMTHLTNKNMKLAKCTMTGGFVCVAILILIFSFVDVRMSP